MPNEKAMSSLFTDFKDKTMLQEMLKECELAEEYLQAMKKTMLKKEKMSNMIKMMELITKTNKLFVQYFHLINASWGRV